MYIEVNNLVNYQHLNTLLPPPGWRNSTHPALQEPPNAPFQPFPPIPHKGWLTPNSLVFPIFERHVNGII